MNRRKGITQTGWKGGTGWQGGIISVGQESPLDQTSTAPRRTTPTSYIYGRRISRPFTLSSQYIFPSLSQSPHLIDGIEKCGDRKPVFSPLHGDVEYTSRKEKDRKEAKLY